MIFKKCGRVRNLRRVSRIVGCREEVSLPDREVGRSRSPLQTNMIMNPVKLSSVVRNTGRALAASLVLTAVSAAADKPYSKIVTFGDSLSDTGNAFLYTGGAYPAALHTVWIGANDLFTTLTFGGNMGLTIHHAVQNTAQSVVALASHGARHILVANLPDLGLTPFGRSLGPIGSAQLSYLTDVYNAGLDKALDSLDAAGIPTIRLDAAGLIREIAADPEGFGLVNATQEAVDSGNNADDYLFWDGVHPTIAGHLVVAERAVEELVEFYSPRRGRGTGPGLVNSLNGLVNASSH